MPTAHRFGSVTESELIALAQAGDPEAADQLLRRHGPGILRICRKLSDDPAQVEDLFQETMMEVVRLLPTFRGESSLLTWAFMIARTRRSRRLRRRRIHTEWLDDAADGPALDGDPSSELEASELRGALEHAIASLSELDRDVLLARDLHGYSAPEVAEITGLSVPAVKTRLHRARVAVRAELTRHLRGSGASSRARV